MKWDWTIGFDGLDNFVGLNLWEHRFTIWNFPIFYGDDTQSSWEKVISNPELYGQEVEVQ